MEAGPSPRSIEDQKVCQSSLVLTVYLEEIYEKHPWGCLLFWQFAGKVSVSPTAFWILVDDSKHYPMDFSHLTPTQMLRTLTEQAGMSVTELGKLLGSKGAASELLSGKRKEPTKTQIAKLCARFKVDAQVFLLPVKAPAHAA